jgi:hypothetical protein
MKSKAGRKNSRKIGLEGEPLSRPADAAGPETTPIETLTDSEDDDEFDESDLEVVDDDRWDVFILDGDEPLPDYGDFWFPD